MSDDNVMSERPRELARSGPEVGKMMANKNGGSGARHRRIRRRRAARGVPRARGRKMELGGEGRCF